MTVPRRVRTQAERVTDDHAWRAAGDGEPRCTLIPGGSSCYCTGRPGCLASNEDSWDEEPG